MTGVLGATVRSLGELVMPQGFGRARRLMERNLTVARRQRWVLVSGFFEPVFYLFSLGIGVGALVGTLDRGDGVAVPYAVYVAPAMLAASAMNGAVAESTMNVFFKLKYARLYDAVLATPLRPGDVAVAEIGFAQLRGAVYSAAFLLVMAAMGYLRSWWALLALPAVVLVGLAFAGVGMAATTWMRSWQDFDLITVATLPMFLFSGTFAPLSSYPPAVRWAVEVLPLHHAVVVVRGLCLGMPDVGMLWHLGYLVAMGMVGLAVASVRLERLLLR